MKENPNEWLLIKQFRKKKRSLHEATARKGHKEPNRTQKRSSAYIKNKNDEYITLPSKSYKQVGITSLRLLSHNNNWQYIRNAV